MHGRELARVRVRDVEVQGLGLADERAAVRGHVEDALLLDLPRRLVERLEVVGDGRDALDGALVGDDLVPDLRRPQAPRDEVLEEVLVDDGELAREHAPRVHVRREGLEGLVVAEDLRRRRRGHGREEERVAAAVLAEARAQPLPVPAVRRLHVPQVELEEALGRRRPFVGVVGPELPGEVDGRLHGPEVDGLEDVLVDPLRVVGLVGVPQLHQRVGHALDADADGPVLQVRRLGRAVGVVARVDRRVQIRREDARDALELVEVDLAVAHEVGQHEGPQIADGDLAAARVLDDLAAQIRALDGPQMPVVRLGVAGVLVEHVGRARLDLAVEDGEPELLRGDGLARAALGLVALVERLELRAVAVREARALVGAHEGPEPVSLDALHEQVRDPEAVEEIARALELVAVVLLEVEPRLDVRVPGLEVDGEGALALAAALVHVARRVVVDAEHGHDAVRRAVRPADVRIRRADVVHRQADAARVLGDGRAALERVVDALDGVLLHGQQEARRQLGARRAGVEERRRRVREHLLRHHLVGLQRAREVVAVDAQRDAHDHVLRPLRDRTVEAHEVTPLERLEPEIVVLEVAVVDDGRVDRVLVLLHRGVSLVGNQRRGLLRLGVHVLVELLDDVGERLVRRLVEVRHGDARGEHGEVGVLRRHVGRRLGRELVELVRRHAVVDALDHLLRDLVRLDVLGVEAVAELLDAARDLVVAHGLLLAVALHDLHVVVRGHRTAALAEGPAERRAVTARRGRRRSV
mmetsp:Transcript_29694/g.97086  ORF Transcript_29694/g.97086 Transcript_29694/m.97086 type:complete len:755 (-) Transcript_29694:490-2754(-)